MIRPALLCLLLALLGPGAATARPLVLGSVADDPQQEIKYCYPLADYLAQRLRDHGIDKGRVVVVASLPEMVAQLKAGEVDLYVDSPFPILAVSRATDAKILLRRWKKGKAEYGSVIVVPAHSPVRDLKDLRGKVIAFESPYSTSGYFLPKSALVAAGLRLREYPPTARQVAAQVIGYAFSNDMENTLLWVVRGKVSAGGVGVHDLEAFHARQPGLLRVIHETPAVPRNLLAVRKDLDPALVSRLREILIAMEHSEEGRRVLEQFERTVRFDDPPGGLQQALAPLLRLGKEIDRELARQ